MQIYDVTNVILDDDKLVCALFDGRYDAIAIIRFNTEASKFEVSESDGEERIKWIEAFGLLSEDEIEAEYYTLSLKPAMRKALYRKLKLDLED